MVLGMMTSCSEETKAWDPYDNWQMRNAEWFEQVTDSARTAIAEAKAKYGDDWEEHCQWRRYKSLQLSSTHVGDDATDSICVKVLKRGQRGEGVESPIYSDTVRVSHRGWLMNTTYQTGDGTRYESMYVFSQSYYGQFDSATCAPGKMSVSGTIEGFGTALQYMVPGDDWLVYIPQQMAYGALSQGEIPAYSTLLFHLNLAAIYHVGTTVPSWK